MPIKKLPVRAIHVVLPLVITFIMTCVVSFVSTAKNLGFAHSEFVHSWIGAWGISWVIAFPVLLFVLPLARRIVFSFVEQV